MDTKKVLRRMKLVIPAMILCMIGDYCIGIEPTSSYEIGGMASTGWVTISDFRILLSNCLGAVGSVLYAIGAIEYIRFLIYANKDNKNRADQFWLKMYYAALGLGCVSFMYFHIAVGGLIQHFNVLYDSLGGNIDAVLKAWNRMFLVEAVPFIVFFIGFDVFATVAWIALIIRRIIPESKVWIIAAPLLMTCIGSLIDLLPWPVNGMNSGYETLGWMLMFVCGIRYIKKQEA